MYANRISYAYDFKGPNYTLDSGCSSALQALVLAMNDIKLGLCDSAIVGGCNVFFKPLKMLHLHKLTLLSEDGYCRFCDKSGDGFVRAEAVIVYFLQKAKNARRTYATVVHGKVNVDGYKDEGIIHPSGEMQRQLMMEVYQESGVNPADVVYFEAHGTGTPVGDPQEINAVTDVFCTAERKAPLLIGSVKSNMGHAECASGCCALAKLMLSFETGVLPANLHFEDPNEDIPSLFDGRVKVVDKNTPLSGDLVSVSGFGIGGANAHVILRRNTKGKLNKGAAKSGSEIPMIVTASGCTKAAVDGFLNETRENANDPEFLSLVHDIYSKNIPNHLFRGFDVFDGKPENSREINNIGDLERPVWYVFSGFGGQWAGMGKDLLTIECFRSSVDRCAQALKHEGFDVLSLFEKCNESTYEDPLNVFVGLAALQIGLFDLLSHLDIVPDGFAGNSSGDLICAYADGALTLEQTMLVAYSRGKAAAEQTKKNPGLMAFVNLGYEEAKKLCPAGVVITSDNSDKSVTVSGTVETVKKFIVELKSKNIFAAEVNTAGYICHTDENLDSTRESVVQALAKIIGQEKKRSTKWISTTFPNPTNDAIAQTNCALYHVNNIRLPVLFKQALQQVPDNALIIEIGPHHLLKSVIQECCPLAAVVSLQKSKEQDSLAYLLNAIGKMYNEGGNPNLSKLYPPVDYPVGRGTAMINSMVQWDHSIKWHVPSFTSETEEIGERVAINPSVKEYKSLEQHKIDGRVILPLSGCLLMVWKILAKQKKVHFEKLPVVFEDVTVNRATIIPNDGDANFLVNIFKGSSEFEIVEGGAVVASGKVRALEESDVSDFSMNVTDEKLEYLNDDIYKEFRLRGYQFEGEFQSIVASNFEGTVAKLKWSNDWLTFIDGLVQFPLINDRRRDRQLMLRFQRAVLNPVEMKKCTTSSGGVFTTYDPYANVVKTRGVEIQGCHRGTSSEKQIIYKNLRQRQFTFVPFVNDKQLFDDPEVARRHALFVILQIACGFQTITFKVAEVVNEKFSKDLVMSLVIDLFDDELGLNVSFFL